MAIKHALPIFRTCINSLQVSISVPYSCNLSFWTAYLCSAMTCLYVATTYILSVMTNIVNSSEKTEPGNLA